MRNKIYLFALATIALVSCRKEEIEMSEANIKESVTDFSSEIPESGAIKNTSYDVVFKMASSYANQGYYAVFTTSGNGKISVSRNGETPMSGTTVNYPVRVNQADTLQVTLLSSEISNIDIEFMANKKF